MDRVALYERESFGGVLVTKTLLSASVGLQTSQLPSQLPVMSLQTFNLWHGGCQVIFGQRAKRRKRGDCTFTRAMRIIFTPVP
jgi:hypothetical protein